MFDCEGLGKHKHMFPKSEFDMCKQVCVRVEGTGRQGEEWLKSQRSRSRVSGEKYEHGPQHKLRFSCFLWPGHARTFPPCSHAQSQSNSWESRQKVGGAWTMLKFSQSSSERLRFRLQHAPHVPRMPARRPLSDMPPRRSILWIYNRHTPPVRCGAGACGDQLDYARSAHNHSHWWCTRSVNQISQSGAQSASDQYNPPACRLTVALGPRVSFCSTSPHLCLQVIMLQY